MNNVRSIGDSNNRNEWCVAVKAATMGSLPEIGWKRNDFLSNPQEAFGFQVKYYNASNPVWRQYRSESVPILIFGTEAPFPDEAICQQSRELIETVALFRGTPLEIFNKLTKAGWPALLQGATSITHINARAIGATG